MDIFELILDADKESGVFALSHVDDPAMEEQFVKFSKADKAVKFATQDEEKRIVMGTVLVPNRLITRVHEGNEYQVFMSADTIRKVSQRYLAGGHQNNTTIEHSFAVEGVSTVESWIVEDAMRDKSTLYNLNSPVGSWVVSQKVDNNEVWNDYIKTGDVKGYSIEGFFKHVPHSSGDSTLNFAKMLSEALKTEAKKGTE